MQRLLLIGTLAAAGCGGSLSHRSVENVQAAIPLGPEIRRVRVELANCTLGIAAADSASQERELIYSGGVRRAADTAELLSRLEQVPISLSVEPDAGRPDTLILRGPQLAPDTAGLIAFEAGMHLPADIELEVVVAENGHVTLEDRAARSLVTTGRGDLRFGRCAGGIEARTGRGTVIVFGHRGDLDVHTMVGDLNVFVAEPGERIRLITGKGTVQCHVPESIEFEVDARAEVGRVGNGFGLEVQSIGDFGAALVGRRGAGTTAVVLRTGSGRISFTPRKAD
jgi:hypothetical protein